MAESSYGATADAKQIAGIASTEDRFDTEMANYLKVASRHIDNVLRNYTTVPTSTNNTLDDIANDYAAGLWLENQEARNKARMVEAPFGDGKVPTRTHKSIQRARAEEALDRYAKSYYTEEEAYVYIVNQ